MSHSQKMFELAKGMLTKAYAPYSKFRVGCCIRSSSDQYYTGCNVENASYSLACCAETTAITQMIAHGEKEITEIVVIAESEYICVPCGACRQRIREFASLNTPIHMGNHQAISLTKTVEELLPHSFGPEFLEK